MRSTGCRLLVCACAGLAAGCASTLSALGGTPTYACKAPEGVLCTSVAGVYANSLQNNLPSQRIEKRPDDNPAKAVTASRAAAGPSPAPNTGSVANSASAPDAASIRSAPRILRVWLAPWEDSDGDLQDQSYLYVVVDAGHWLIEHQRDSIRSAYTPITAPNPGPGDANEPVELTPSTSLNLPRPGAPSFPTGTPSLPAKINNDAESAPR